VEAGLGGAVQAAVARELKVLDHVSFLYRGASLIRKRSRWLLTQPARRQASVVLCKLYDKLCCIHINAARQVERPFLRATHPPTNRQSNPHANTQSINQRDKQTNKERETRAQKKQADQNKMHTQTDNC
jgi:hypothetical protein